MNSIIDQGKQKKPDASAIQQQSQQIPSKHENNQFSQRGQAETVQNRAPSFQNGSFHAGSEATRKREPQQTMVTQFYYTLKQNNNIKQPTVDPANDPRFGNLQQQQTNSQDLSIKQANSNLANSNKEEEKIKQISNPRLNQTLNYSESKVQRTTNTPAQQGFQDIKVNKLTQSSETTNSQIPSGFQKQTQEILQNSKNTEIPNKSFTRNQAQPQNDIQLISQNSVQNRTNFGINPEKPKVFQNSKMELENQQSEQINFNQIQSEQTAQEQKIYFEPINTYQQTPEKILENQPLPTEGDKKEIQKLSLNIQTKPKYQNSLSVINKLLEICRKNNIIDPELEDLEKFTKLKFQCCDAEEQKIFLCKEQKCIFHLNCLRNRLDSFDSQQEYKCQCDDVLPIRVLQELDTIQTRCWLEKRLELESQDLKFKLNREILKCSAPFCTFWCYQSETYQPHQNYYCISCQVSTNLERPQIVIQQYR